ncbi:5-oxoprolinase subunit B family protein [Nonomuraea aurantiaca]|uniref:5-oxoprolinase subunit B family protein n=1 Tax=Nonomuraea aurantiaca TaxID=2878562 RepID=UPI001CDA0EBE|nr:allophanate hydrolase subunit 1 [Nonomuraea aurantiaca]MCA2219827.1 allophanate hydrolase subunit 1 [Nonomuraea aurantiaca]
MIRVAGEHGLLVETGSLAVSHRLDAVLRATRPAGVVEVVPGPETVLVVAPGADQGRLRSRLDELLGEALDPGEPGKVLESRKPGDALDSRRPAEPVEPRKPAGSVEYWKPGEVSSGGGPEVVVIPVVYDGEDLDSVAELAGMSVDDVIARHTGRELVVGWLGFAPGFAYLTGLDPALHLPRLATPRTSVPAGSVAIAGPYSAIYPTASPGGWRLLGRTATRIWDVDADPPSLFRPGTRVRFEPA